MGIDTELVLESNRTIALHLVGLLALKAVLIFIIARISGLTTTDSAEAGVYLSQGGEFAFVIFAAALSSGFDFWPARPNCLGHSRPDHAYYTGTRTLRGVGSFRGGNWPRRSVWMTHRNEIEVSVGPHRHSRYGAGRFGRPPKRCERPAVLMSGLIWIHMPLPLPDCKGFRFTFVTQPGPKCCMP